MSINGVLSAPVDRRYDFSIRLAPKGRAPTKAQPLRYYLALIKIPDRFLNMLAQQSPFICGHHAVPWGPLGRLRIAWRRGHGCLRVAIPIRWLLHAMLSAHETAIEAFSGLLRIEIRTLALWIRIP